MRPQPKPARKPKKPRKALPRRRVKPRRKYPGRIDDTYRQFVRSLSCCAPHVYQTADDLVDSEVCIWLRFDPADPDHTGVDPHHTRSRAAGGSDYDCIPLSRTCHRQVERFTVQFKHWTKASRAEWYAAMVWDTRRSYLAAGGALPVGVVA